MLLIQSRKCLLRARIDAREREGLRARERAKGPGKLLLFAIDRFLIVFQSLSLSVSLS
jgi:hypothetical protein